MADWWTPLGMETHDAPDRPEDWSPFTKTTFMEDEALKVMVRRRPDNGCLQVELWEGADQLLEFFVDGRHQASFLLDKYPSLVLMTRQITAAEKQIAQATALVAFVRHGQGVRTVSEDGLRDFETLTAEVDAERLRREHQLRQKSSG